MTHAASAIQTWRPAGSRANCCDKHSHEREFEKLTCGSECHGAPWKARRAQCYAEVPCAGRIWVRLRAEHTRFLLRTDEFAQKMYVGLEISFQLQTIDSAPAYWVTLPHTKPYGFDELMYGFPVPVTCTSGVTERKRSLVQTSSTVKPTKVFDVSG